MFLTGSDSTEGHPQSSLCLPPKHHEPLLSETLVHHSLWVHRSAARPQAVTALLVRRCGQAVCHKVRFESQHSPLWETTFCRTELGTQAVTSQTARAPRAAVPGTECVDSWRLLLGAVSLPRGRIPAHLCGFDLPPGGRHDRGTSPGPGQMVGAEPRRGQGPHRVGKPNTPGSPEGGPNVTRTKGRCGNSLTTFAPNPEFQGESVFSCKIVSQI